MEAMRLTIVESSIARAIEDSRPIEAGVDNRLPIRAGVLRRFILQQEVLLHNENEPRIIRVAETGLKLRFLRITDGRSIIDGVEDLSEPCGPDGILDLEDACAAGGGVLPPIELEYCFFSCPIHFTRARVRRLSLKGSSLMHLFAENLHLEGPLDISSIKSAEADAHTDLDLPRTGAVRAEPKPIKFPVGWGRFGGMRPGEFEKAFNKPPSPPVGTQGLCWIQLAGSRIAGDLRASSAHLCAPALLEDRVDSPASRYALELPRCHIHGRVILDDGFSAVGGINLGAAHVTGSVFVVSASLIGIERDAFNANNAHIEGFLALDYVSLRSSPGLPCRIEGTVDIANAKVDSAVFLRCAEITEDNRGRVWVNALGVHIGLGFILSGPPQGSLPPSGNHVLPFYCAGGVNLHNAVIEGDLNMDGAIIGLASPNSLVSADGISVSGKASFSVCVMNEILFPFIATGSVDFSHGVFKADLIMRGARIGAKQDGIALAATGISVEGDAQFGLVAAFPESLPFLARGVIQLNGGRFEGEVSFDSARIMLPISGLKTTALEAQFLKVRGSFAFYGGAGYGAARYRLFRPVAKGAILLGGSSVGHHIVISGSIIRSRDPNSYALSIDNSDIHSQIIMDPQLDSNGDIDGDGNTQLCLRPCEIYGGVSFVKTTVGDSLLMRGTHLVGGIDREAIFATEVSVGTGVRFGPFEQKTPKGTLKELFKATGTVVFTASRVTSEIEASGYFDGRGSVALNASFGAMQQLILNDSTFIGDVDLSYCKASQQIAANNIQLKQGSMSLTGIAADSISMHDLRLTITKPRHSILDLQRATITSTLSLNLGGIDYQLGPDGLGPYAGFIDMRHLSVGEIDDNYQRRHEYPIVLRLDGMKQRKAPHRPIVPMSPSSYLARLIFWIHHRINVLNRLGRPHPLRFLVRLLRWLDASANSLYQHLHTADGYTDWLNLQYKNPLAPNAEEFSPSAYDLLSRLLRDDGYDTKARRILSAKLTTKRKVDVFYFARPAWWLYHRLFDYGLSAGRALITCALFLLLGCVGVRLACRITDAHPQRPILVVATSAVSAVVGPTYVGNQIKFDLGIHPDTAMSGLPIPCNSTHVNSFLYALELMVPAQNLGETKFCEVSTDPSMWPWRILKTLYIICGWIITSITLLTIPGILRSRAEG